MPVQRPKKEKGKRLWFRIVIHILPWIVKSYFRFVDLTSRKIFLNRHFEEEMERAGSFAVAGFHGTLLYPCYYCKRFSGVIMVSRSWDGDLMATCLRAWGYETARGSSSRDGKEALHEMIDMAKTTNCCTGLAVDAPRGPAQIVKMGIVALARETGQPILPITSWTTRHVQFKSWDKMILPLPFGTIVMNYGKPMRVSRELRKEDYEIVRQEIENSLLQALFEAKAKVAELKGLATQTSIKTAPGS
jgi:hypothetical protein